MIKLTLPPEPPELTANEATLTTRYKATGESVWKQEYITEALLKMSGGKCAYSEQPLNTQSNYMEVEHFRHKKMYPDDVVRWGNLLPSCKKCNTTKGEWDVEKEPIVNPLVDEPSEHLMVQAFRYYAKTPKGQNTIKAVALNDRQHFVTPRAKIAMKIADSLEELSDHIGELKQRHRQKIIAETIKSYLKECAMPDSPYSAVIATFLLHDWKNYPVMKQQLQSLNMWEEEFAAIENSLKRVAMPFSDITSED